MNWLGLVLIAMLLLLVVAIAYGMVKNWPIVVLDDTPLPLLDLLQRRPSNARRGPTAEILAYAVRRCQFCDRKQECREWLASQEQAVGPPYCPNARLLFPDHPAGSA